LLLQELQVLRRTVTEAREAFVEQERNFVSLDSVPSDRDYASILEQHRLMQAEHKELEREYPALESEIRVTKEAVEGQREDIKKAGAEVARLEEELAMHLERQDTLQSRVKIAEREVERTKSSTSALQLNLEEIMKKKGRQDVLKELVISDKAILVTQRELLTAGSKSKKDQNKRGGNAAPVANSSTPAPPTVVNSTEPITQPVVARLDVPQPGTGTSPIPKTNPLASPKSSPDASPKLKPRSAPKKKG